MWSKDSTYPNRNSIPSDPNGAWYTSGVRLGTPALTTLGLGPTDMDEVSEIITAALHATSATATKSGWSPARYVIDQMVADECRQRGADLLSRQPLYPQVHLS